MKSCSWVHLEAAAIVCSSCMQTVQKSVAWYLIDSLLPLQVIVNVQPLMSDLTALAELADAHWQIENDYAAATSDSRSHAPVWLIAVCCCV